MNNLLKLLCFCGTFILTAAEVFHFDFATANGKTQISDSTGNFRCIADGSKLSVQHGALRIAPAANIYITGKFPEMKREMSVSLWFARRDKSWDTPLLMRGYHSGKVDFLLQCRYVFPSFCYKDPQNKGHWEGLYVVGPIPRDMSYGKKEWRLNTLYAYPEIWSLLQVTFKDGETKIYLDGKLNCRNISAKKTLSSGEDRIYIGSERLSPKAKLGYLTGDLLINDIRIFDTALSEIELKQIFKTEKTKYPKTKIKFDDCDSYPPVPGYDPEFKNKLKATNYYETKILPKLNTAINPNESNSRTVMHNGARVLEIGKQIYFPLQLSPSKAKGLKKLEQQVLDFSASGIKLVNLSVAVEACWKGEKLYDFSAVDNTAKAILKVNPQARMLVWTLLRPPPWFCQKYPDEIEQSKLGSSVSRNIAGGPLGSDIWDKQVNEYLAALVRHVENSSYGARVYAYLPAGGESGEWYWPGGVYRMTVGFSPATAITFRNWLKNKYGSDEKLSKAWNQPQITLSTVQVPDVSVREKLDNPSDFVDHKLRQDVYDFRQYMGDRTIAAIRKAASVIKKNCNNRKLVFLYNGYSFAATAQKLYNSGLFITEAVLDNPQIDVIVTPITYSERQGGQFGACENPWSASALLHGKLPWQEDDPRTHFCFTSTDGRSETPAETSEIFKRDIGLTLTKNIGNWWLFFQPDWAHDELTMNTVAKSQKIVDSALKHPREPVAQVAFIWDEKSLLELNRVRGNFFSDFAYLAYKGSFQMGAPADFYLSSDLLNSGMKDYKLYVMLNFFRVDEKLRQAIELKAKRNNAVVVWCYAPGYITDKGFDLTAMEKLTGFKFQQFHSRKKYNLTITDHNHPITKYAPARFKPYNIAPAFAVIDPQAQILGKANDFGALAVHEYPQWRSIYTLFPLEKELLMGLCDYSGIHVYSRSYDFVSVNSGFMLVHTIKSGKKEFNLPGKYNVKEVYSNKSFGKNVSKFTAELAKGTTAIFKLDKIQ